MIPTCFFPTNTAEIRISSHKSWEPVENGVYPKDWFPWFRWERNGGPSPPGKRFQWVDAPGDFCWMMSSFSSVLEESGIPNSILTNRKNPKTPLKSGQFEDPKPHPCVIFNGSNSPFRRRRFVTVQNLMLGCLVGQVYNSWKCEKNAVESEKKTLSSHPCQCLLWLHLKNVFPQLNDVVFFYVSTCWWVWRHERQA